MQPSETNQVSDPLFELLPAFPFEYGALTLPLPRVLARQIAVAPRQFPFPVAGIAPQLPAEAPPGLPPSPQPRAVPSAPPPPAPVTSTRKIFERRGI